MIRFSDLRALHDGIRQEIEASFASSLDRSAFVGGQDVSSFEEAFADWQRSKGAPASTRCVGCGNGTDALELVLRALGVGPGHRVATVANTFFATVEAILSVGAEPLFVDVDPGTMLMDPDRLGEAMDPAVRVVLPVHLYGQCCDMGRILSIASRWGAAVVEDCAQAHGALWEGRPAGSFGVAGTFSFFPGKNLGALGDGGMVACADPGLEARVRRLANHGRADKYLHLEAGRNSRLDALQASILSVKLRHLDDWNARRGEAAAEYLRLLSDSPVELPATDPRARSVWHLFVVRIRNRDEVSRRLHELGVETGIHYPVPLHRQPFAAGRDWARASLPVTESVTERILSLPMHPHLDAAQVDLVCRALLQAAS